MAQQERPYMRKRTCSSKSAGNFLAKHRISCIPRLIDATSHCPCIIGDNSLPCVEHRGWLKYSGGLLPSLISRTYQSRGCYVSPCHWCDASEPTSTGRAYSCFQRLRTPRPHSSSEVGPSRLLFHFDCCLGSIHHLGPASSRGRHHSPPTTLAGRHCNFLGDGSST